MCVNNLSKVALDCAVGWDWTRDLQSQVQHCHRATEHGCTWQCSDWDWTRDLQSQVQRLNSYATEPHEYARHATYHYLQCEADYRDMVR